MTEDFQANPAPKLSIIVATYNAAATLPHLLASIEAQTFKHWELLISDGGSTDQTVSMIRQSPATWWRSSKDLGIYDAWNQALSHARGQYICFLGADDAWATPTAIEQLFEAMANDEYDLVTSTGRIVNYHATKSMIFGSAWNFRRIGRRMLVCHPGLLHHRRLFEHYGQFDLRYRIAGDLEFLLRLGEDIRALHVDMISVVIEGAGISRSNVLKRLREQRAALSRCERFGPLRAYLIWMDKLWRYPVARLFGLPH
jgi:glycosyltransferase involved in cell wall biosynthesis